jgi:hypothetical protein
MTEYEFETFYPRLREVLDERFAGLPDDQLEAAFEIAFGEGVTPAEYEEFFAGLSKALSKAAPVLTSIGQGALKGASAGSIAGPWGALGGALLGGAGGALQQHTTGPARDIGGALTGVVNTAGALTGGGGPAGGASGLLGLLGGGGRGPATNALRNVMARPDTAQALGALFRGRNPSIPVGARGIPVPANAFAGLLGALAREAEAEASWDDAEAVPAYLVDAAGQIVVDPSNLEHRAARLLQLMAGSEAAAEYDDAEYDDAEYGAAKYDDADYEDASAYDWPDLNLSVPAGV